MVDAERGNAERVGGGDVDAYWQYRRFAGRVAALARAGFAYAVACRVIDAASPDDLPATV